MFLFLSFHVNCSFLQGPKIVLFSKIYFRVLILLNTFVFIYFKLNIKPIHFIYVVTFVVVVVVNVALRKNSFNEQQHHNKTLTNPHQTHGELPAVLLKFLLLLLYQVAGVSTTNNSQP